MDLILDENIIGELFQEIDIELEDYNQSYKILFLEGCDRRIANDSKRRIDFYRKEFFELPLDTILVKKNISIFRSFYELDILGREFKEVINLRELSTLQLTVDQIASEVENRANYIWCKLSEKFQNIDGNYPNCLIQARKRLAVSENTEEEIVIEDLLIHYNNILCRKDIQLKVFNDLIVPKSIADLYTQIWIEFFKRRLRIINPSLLNSLKQDIQVEENPSIPQRIIWNGSQKELAELFVELEHKGWIKSVSYGERSKIARSILQLFDISQTKRGKGTDELKSFGQVYKGEPSAVNKSLRSFPAIYTLRYKRKFDQMLRNLNQK